jgi:hypothetical protein
MREREEALALAYAVLRTAAKRAALEAAIPSHHAQRHGGADAPAAEPLGWPGEREVARGVAR